MFLFQKLPHLESLNLCACKHLTDRSAWALSKHAHNLKELNLSWITTISETSIIDIMTNCSQLVFLDIYDHRISQDSRRIIADIARERKMKIVLKGITDNDIAPENPCSLLPNFGKVWYNVFNHVSWPCISWSLHLKICALLQEFKSKCYIMASQGLKSHSGTNV